MHRGAVVGAVVARVALMLMPSQWFVAVEPVDLRCGIDRLLVAVQTLRSTDAFDGAAYVFRNRAGTRLKLLLADAGKQGSGCNFRVRRSGFDNGSVNKLRFSAMSAARPARSPLPVRVMQSRHRRAAAA